MKEAQVLYNLIKESFLLLDFGDRSVFEGYGLTVPRYYAMHHIAQSPGISPSRLSTLMFCDKSNITRLLHSLEADGYVERRSHESDGRVQRLYLTSAGAALHQSASNDHGVTVERRMSSLVERDRKGLSELLKDLNQTLTEELSHSQSELAGS